MAKQSSGPRCQSPTTMLRTSATGSARAGGFLLCLAACIVIDCALAFAPSYLGAPAGVRKFATSGSKLRSGPSTALRMQETKEKKDVEEVTKKYGLEAGVFTALT